jgi:voltage-gated potassium channel
MIINKFRNLISLTINKHWFPQGPLSLGVAVLGFWYLIPVIDHAQSIYNHIILPGATRQDLSGVNLEGITQLLFGIFLLVISIGLHLQSRISWFLSVLVTIGLAVQSVQIGISSNYWLFAYNLVLIALLLTTRKSFNNINIQIGTMASIVALLVLISYAVFGTYYLGDQFKPNINNLVDAFYVSIITMTTVGFGDFSPATTESRMFVVSIIFFSAAVLSTAVGATLIPALVHRIEEVNLRKKKKMNRSDHFIIVGYSALSSNTYRELSLRNEKVTIILRTPVDKGLFVGDDIDILIGDGSDEATLIEAGADKAKAILALLDDDSENAFVVLAVKELQIKAKTVAAVNNRKHLNRLRHVRPDIILAPQVLGGELLTSMLMGEHIDIKNIMGKLLGQKK